MTRAMVEQPLWPPLSASHCPDLAGLVAGFSNGIRIMRGNLVERMRVSN